MFGRAVAAVAAVVAVVGQLVIVQGVAQLYQIPLTMASCESVCGIESQEIYTYMCHCDKIKD